MIHVIYIIHLYMYSMKWGNICLFWILNVCSVSIIQNLDMRQRREQAKWILFPHGSEAHLLLLSCGHFHPYRSGGTSNGQQRNKSSLGQQNRAFWKQGHPHDGGQYKTKAWRNGEASQKATDCRKSGALALNFIIFLSNLLLLLWWTKTLCNILHW